MLLHWTTPLEQQVTTILDLIGGITVGKVTRLWLGQAQAKTEPGGINPVVIHLAQLPYHVFG